MSGFQDNNEIKIDVVYTKTGRQYKAAGSDLAIPKKIAFSDDGIDYNLYDSNQVDGKKGLKIERTPLLSACTSDGAIMKYKLLTLPKQTSETINTFNITQNTINMVATENGRGEDINTVNVRVNYPSPQGFRIILLDTSYLYINEPPVFEERRASSGRNYNQTKSFAETLLIGDESGMNKRQQTVQLDGSNQSPFNLSFQIVYGGHYKRFSRTQDHKTKVIVESIDTGYTQELDVTLSKESI
jgi:hypothetical protein